MMLVMSKETDLNDTNGKKQSYFKVNHWPTFRQLENSQLFEHNLYIRYEEGKNVQEGIF